MFYLGAPSRTDGGKSSSEFHLRRIAPLLTLMVSVLMVVGFATKSNLWQSPPAVLDANPQLAQSEVSSRIVMQQLDEVFDSLSTSMRDRGQLTEQDVRLLRIWKNYDEQYLVSTRNNASVRYMRANARFRLGLIEQMLGENEAAASQFQQAAEIFEVLVSESPSQPSHLEELIICWMNACENALRIGDKQCALECIGKLEEHFGRREFAQLANGRGFQQMLILFKTRVASLP